VPSLTPARWLEPLARCDASNPRSWTQLDFAFFSASRVTFHGQACASAVLRFTEGLAMVHFTPSASTIFLSVS